MPFRFWYYAGKAAPLVILAAGAICVLSRGQTLLESVAWVFALLLVILGIAGAVMGILMVAGKLRMRCPFCGQKGPAWGSRDEGMRMECPSCGLIRGDGRLGLRLIREGTSEDPGAETAAEVLEDVPVRQRPRLLPLFPLGSVHFRHWRSVRWFLLMLAPLAASLLAAWRRGNLGAGVFLLVLGAVLACVVFVQVSSGMSSSNWGTYFRSKEPVRFWVDVAIPGAAYVATIIAGWFV